MAKKARQHLQRSAHPTGKAGKLSPYRLRPMSAVSNDTSKAIAALTALLFITGCSQTLSPFTSDGCSSFPDGTPAQSTLWQDCCTIHDLAYWKGGSYSERLAADKNLQSCVASVGQSEIATLMLAGVRVGGSPYWPTSFRWGYGWSYPRGYKTLDENERQRVQQLQGSSD